MLKMHFLLLHELRNLVRIINEGGLANVVHQWWTWVVAFTSNLTLPSNCGSIDWLLYLRMSIWHHFFVILRLLHPSPMIGMEVVCRVVRKTLVLLNIPSPDIRPGLSDLIMPSRYPLSSLMLLSSLCLLLVLFSCPILLHI